MEIRDLVINIAKQAKEASSLMASASTEKKNKALLILAELLDKERELIKKENIKI